jgi:hypothetical protein
LDETPIGDRENYDRIYAVAHDDLPTLGDSIINKFAKAGFGMLALLRVQ